MKGTSSLPNLEEIETFDLLQIAWLAHVCLWTTDILQGYMYIHFEVYLHDCMLVIRYTSL